MGIYDEAIVDVVELKRAAEENAKRALTESVAPRIKRMVDELLSERASPTLIGENSDDDDSDALGTLLDDDSCVTEGGPIVVAPKTESDDDELDELKLGVSGVTSDPEDKKEEGEDDVNEAGERMRPAEMFQRRTFTRKGIQHICAGKVCMGVDKRDTATKRDDDYDGAIIQNTKTGERLGVVLKVGDDQYEIWPAINKGDLELVHSDPKSHSYIDPSLTGRVESTEPGRAKRKANESARKQQVNERCVAGFAEEILSAATDPKTLKAIRVRLAEATGIARAGGAKKVELHERLKRLSVVINELIGAAGAAGDNKMLQEGDVSVRIGGLPDDIDLGDLTVDIEGAPEDGELSMDDELPSDDMGGGDDLVDMEPAPSMGEGHLTEDDAEEDDEDMEESTLIGDEGLTLSEIMNLPDDVVLEVHDDELNEELERMRSRAALRERRQERASASRLVESAKKKKTERENVARSKKEDDNEAESVSVLREEADRQRQAADRLADRLRRSNLTNAKLVYTNMLLQNDSLTSRQRQVAAARLDEAKSLREAKLVYDSLVMSAGAEQEEKQEKKASPAGAQGATRQNNRLGSSSQPTRSASPKSLNESAGVETQRWAELAGINEGD